VNSITERIRIFVRAISQSFSITGETIRKSAIYRFITSIFEIVQKIMTKKTLAPGISYYIKINVTNSTEYPISPANVTIWNATELVATYNTSSNGSIPVVEVTTSGNPYRIRATNASYLSSDFNRTFNANETLRIILYKENEIIIMYDVAAVMGSVAVAFGMFWLSMNMREEEKEVARIRLIRFLKPLCMFVGFYFLSNTIVIMRNAAVSAEASANMISAIDTMSVIMTWLLS